MTDVICQSEDVPRPEVCFGQQACIDAVLSEEKIQFLLFVMDTVSIPASQP
jgi:hypothetical protein